MSTGYSPQGHRPEPTTASATGSPISPTEGPGSDAYADMSTRIAALRSPVCALSS